VLTIVYDAADAGELGSTATKLANAATAPTPNRVKFDMLRRF
jgi:hypothetical protein